MSARISAVLLCLSFSAFAEDPLLQQPPLKLTVTVGGKEVAVAAGEEKKVEGEFKDPVIKVTAAPARTFSLAGITFDFPAAWSWKAEKTTSGYTWTMQSLNVTLVVSKYDILKVNAKAIASAIAAPEDGHATVEPWSETRGGREFKGWKVAAKLSGGRPATFHVLPIPVKSGSIMAQIVLTSDRAEAAAEFSAVLEMLGKTLRVESD